MPTMRVLKICSRCGVHQTVKPRQRKCHERRFGRGSYACHGDLVRVNVPKLPRAVQVEVPVKIKERPQDVAQRNLESVRAKIKEKTSAMKRLATSITALERKAAYFAKRASMTDAEIEAQRMKWDEQRTARQQRRRRRDLHLEGLS